MYIPYVSDSNDVTSFPSWFDVNIPEKHCDDVRYFCLEIADPKGQGATFEETTYLNNFRCVNVENMMNCSKGE